MTSRAFFLIALLLHLFSRFYCQNETAKWYFGHHAGLDFMTNPPTILTGGATATTSAFPMTEGGACISDAFGNILFYTDGMSVFDQTHSVMSNGSGIAGDWSSSQGAVIIKKPGSTNIYYLFSAGAQGTGSLCVSTIDMSLAAGLGSVTAKNVVLMQNSTEELTAGEHCNGIDSWIIAKNTSGQFQSYLVTSAGVSTTPIQSPVCCNPINGFQGALKISPNGTLVADININNPVSFYSFNSSTGQLSNLFSVTRPGYSGEFSPDGSKFYISGSGALFQYDLCAGSISAIQTSTTYFANSGYAIQLAKNGKIYTIGNSQNLSIINNPNLLGNACGFVTYSQPISPGASCWGLPNFSRALLRPTPAQFSFTANNNSLGCQVASFTTSVGSGTNFSCNYSTKPIIGSLWNFGDPLSGSTNTSNLSNPTHTFSALGNYTVQLVVYYNCGRPDTLSQTLQITQACITAASTSITCANLGSATVTPTPGAGPFNYTWMPSAQNTSVATGLVPGTYTLFYNSPSSNVNSSITVNFQPLIQLTGSVSVTPSITCNGASTGTGQIYGLAGGSGTQTFSWNNSIQSYSNAFTNSLSAGLWSVNVTDALTGCQVNQSFFISQPPALILNLSSNTPTACVGNSIALTGTNSGGTPGYTYTWTNAPPSNTTVVSESVAGTFVYTLASLDSNQCFGSNTIALNFIANPVLSVPDVSICPLKFGTLTASGATSYTWNGTNVGSIYSDNPLSNTQYTVVGSALGCTSIATASIILHPVPVPLIQSNSPRCEGTSMNVNGSGGSVYQWSGPSSFNSVLPFNTVSNLALNHGGTYNLTVTSVNGCTSSTSANLVVNPIPTVSAAGSTVCTSQTLSLFANSLAGANYNWTGPATFVSAVQNPTLANPALNRTGTYSVIATSILGCTNIATAQVSVTSPPNLSVALSSNTLCSQAFNGSPNTITLTGIGANSYTLYTPNLIGSSTPITPTASVFATPPFSSSLAVGTATLQGSNGVCTSTAGFVFTVVPNPTVGVNSFTPVICAGQNYTYTSNGANSYVWTATTPNYTTYSNGGVAVTHPSISSVFSVYGSSLGCNSALQTSSITVYSLPTMTLSALSSSICLNEKTKITVFGTGASYSWTPDNGLNVSTGSVVTCNAISQQVYTVIASANNCTASATTSVHVWSLPIPKIENHSEKICLGDEINLAGFGGLIYDWRGPDHLYIQGQNPVFKAVSSSFGGEYTLTVTDINGCKASTVTGIEILPAPSGYLNNFKEEACAPYCNTFNFLTADKNQKVKSSWMINDQFLNGNTFSYCFNTAGSYTINGSFIDDITNCKNTVSYLLNVHLKPKADFIFTPKQPIEGIDEVLFTNNSSGDGNLSFNWYFNDNKGYSTNQKNTSYLYGEPGEYRVVLVSKNNWKCADTIIKVVKVESDFALYVPNAFTPNGDDRNDIFLPVVRSVKKYDLKIFDRWGKMLFQTTDPNQGWDGTFNGVICKQDVYIWKINVVSLEGKEKSQTGNVTSLPEE